MQIGYGNVFGKTLVGGITNNLISDKRTYTDKTHFHKLKIELVDEWGTIVDLNQIDFSFIMEIEYE